MRSHLLLATVLVAAVTSRETPAQFVADFHPFPVVAHTAGAGNPPTFWKSDVFVYNPGDSVLTIGFRFFPTGQANTFDGTFPVTRVLGANESLRIEDIVATMFGFTGNQKGALIVSCSPKTFPTNPAGSRIVATTRNYNTGSSLGTFGQDIPSCLFYWNSSKELSVSTGGQQDEQFRTNMGIASFSPKPITVWYRIRNARGLVVANGSEPIQPYSMGQWSLASLGVTNQTGPLTAEFWLDPDDVTPDPCSEPDRTNVFVAYLSKVDGNPNGTGDGDHLYAIPSTVPPAILSCPGSPYGTGP
ncbi:MAG TPA: hypothetical protein VMT45_13885 [Thermoanaerobaculaceae bacterium]|nr:hypothetical protein [Thermoanaerobaculaceae bacterium]